MALDFVSDVVFAGTVTVPTPTNNTDAATKLYVDQNSSVTAHEADPNPHTQYALLSGATFTGNISLGTVKLLQNGAGMADPTGVNASMWKTFLSNAGVTADGVYAFEDGTLITLITVSGRLHVTLTNEIGLYKVETSQADNTYHAVTEVTSGGVELWLNNSGGFPTQGSAYGQSPTVRGNLTINGTTTLNTAPTVGAHAVTKTYADGLITTHEAAGDPHTQYAQKAGTTFTGTVTLAGDPGSALQAATKRYVDLTAQGLKFKHAVVAVATSNITLSGAQTIDGVSVVSGDRVLVAGQTTTSENGIYVAAAGSWSRATDADASGEIADGTVVPVAGGTSNGDSLYLCTSTASTPWVAGTDASAWTKYTSLSDLSAGAGLTKSGTTLAVGAGTGITVNADDVAIDTSVVARKFSASFGDGSATSYVITHNLGTKDITAAIRQNADDAHVLADITSTSTTTCTVTLATAPSSNALRITVIG